MSTRKWTKYLLAALLCLVMAAPAFAAPWDGTADTTWYNATDNEFTLTTGEQLAGLAALVNGGNKFVGKTFYLGNDIDLGGTTHKWAPIGVYGKAFCGTFDGRGYTIDNMFVSLSGNSFLSAGLFGIIGDGTSSTAVRNVHIGPGSSVSTTINTGPDDIYTGAVVGDIKTNAEVVNCTNKGTVVTAGGDLSYIGGIAGHSTGKVINCANSGKVSYGATRASKMWIGGIVGLSQNPSSIENCSNEGEVSNTLGVAPNTGGIAGEIGSASTVKNSVNTGIVIGVGKYLGGLIGAHSGRLTDCQWLTVTGGATKAIGDNYGQNQGLESSDKSSFLKAATLIVRSLVVSMDADSEDTVISEVYPTSADVSKKTVVLKSSNPAVATVSGSVIIAMAAGKATITVSSIKDDTLGGAVLSADVDVSVSGTPKKIRVISVDKTLTLAVNEEKPLTIEVAPQSADKSTITWEVSDPSVASVDAQGKVKGLKAGTATVTGKAGKATSNACTVTVYYPAVPVAEITMEGDFTLAKGATHKISYDVKPNNATNKDVSWESDKPEVATVDSLGTVTAIGAGSALIKATAKDGSGKSASLTVTVTQDTPAKPVTGVELSRTTLSLTVGSAAHLIATVSPSDAANKSVTWESSNTAVAAVADGAVTAIWQGTATVTVKTADGGHTAVCAVTVTEQTAKPEPKVPTLPAGTPADITAALPEVLEVSKDATPEQKTEAINKAASVMVGITSADLEVSTHGQVTAKPERSLRIAKAAISKISTAISVDTVMPLPVFTAKPSTAGGTVAVEFVLTGEAFGNKTPEAVRVMKMLSGGAGEFFTYKSDPAQFGDRTFTVHGTDDKLFTGTFEKAAKYQLVLFIKDGAQFDLDGATNTSVTDPVVVVGTSESVGPTPTPSPLRGPSSSGGCSTGFGALALLVFCPMAVNAIRSKK